MDQIIYKIQILSKEDIDAFVVQNAEVFMKMNSAKNAIQELNILMMI